MDDLLASAQRMQEQLLAARADAEATVVEGHSVSIDPSAVDPDDVPMLEDLVLAALHDAVAKAQEAQAGAMGNLDLGGLGGILGP